MNMDKINIDKQGFNIMTCRHTMKWICVVVMLLVLPWYVYTGQESMRPDIVFILADDMGYGDIHQRQWFSGAEWKQHEWGSELCQEVWA